MTFNLLSELDKTALFAEQSDIELLSVTRGVQRARQIRAKAKESSQCHTLTPQQRLIARWMDKLVPAVQALQQQVLNGQGAMGIHCWGIPILSLSAQKLALITLVTVINAQHTNTPLTQLAMAIAAQVKCERQFDVFRKQHRNVYQMLTHKVKKWRKTQFSRMRIKSKVVDEPWKHADRVWLGTILIHALIQTTGQVHHKIISIEKQRVGVVYIDEAVLKDLELQHSECEILKPFMLPMVVPPADWSDDNRGGGYAFLKMDLMKPNVSGDRQFTSLANKVHPFPKQLIRAVNMQQRTPYCINDFVLQHMQAIWKQGGNVAGLPAFDKKPLPPVPQDIDSNPQAKRKWKYEATLVHNDNNKNASERKLALHLFWIAKKFSKYRWIWFPLSLDWRTRIYPVPVVLNPQGDDCAKALLRFGTRKPLGKDGLRWLCIHLANSIGWDKLPYDERVGRVRHLIQTGVLAQWVENPLTNRGWLADDVDSPWQTLAAAKEIYEALKSGNPQTYASSLIVSIDGSCNGLQHLAALGRDQIGGSQTNLVPRERPGDVYTTVCNKVIQIVQKHCQAVQNPDVLTDEDLVFIQTLPKGVDWKVQCLKWQGKVTRKVVKRSVMTKPYGLSLQGCRNQLMTDGWTKDMNKPYDAADYMKTLLFHSIGQVVISAKVLMEWLQDCAYALGVIGYPCRWTTPIGVHCEQAYHKLKQRRVRTLLQQVYLRVPDEQPKLDLRAQVRAIVPNFIHSLDSSHLCLTTLSFCTDDKFLSPVHDSYGTHACDVPELHRKTRHCFVSMHSQPILEYFVASCKELVPGIELPPIPPKGELNLELVKQSLYFFH